MYILSRKYEIFINLYFSTLYWCLSRIEHRCLLALKNRRKFERYQYRLLVGYTQEQK